MANLLLARGLVRQREIAMRIAIGAGRARIIRQLLTESCVLAVLGGIGGYGLTAAAWRILPAIAPVSIPRLAASRVDWRILAFALMIALVNGVLFGMAPALRAGWTRVITTNGLRTQGIASGKRDRIRGSLVAVEVAVTVALVAVGGQLLGSFIDLLRTDPGFETDHVLASVLLPSPERYKTSDQRGKIYGRFLDSVHSIPGVQSAGTVDALPFSGENHGGLIAGNKATATEPRDQIPAEIDVVSFQYLQTMGVRLAEGRWFREEEMKAGDSAIVNDVTASRLWPGTSAVGKQVCVYCTPENPHNWKQIVGVVSSVRHAAMDGPQQASVYLSADALEKAQFLVVRTDRPPRDIEKAIRRAIAGVDPNQAVFLSASMRSLIDDSFADRRFIMTLLAITGCLALAMSVAGVYGVTSYITSGKTQEIGIRMALGATSSNVQLLVFRQGFFTAAVGLTIGTALTLGLMRVLCGVLVGLGAGDLGHACTAFALVSLTAAAACWVPARRAARIDPMAALRED